MTRTLFGIAASTQQYQKTIDYGKTLVDNSMATDDNLAIIAQSYYLLKDCNHSGIWADKSIAAAHRAGGPPKENVYLFKLKCASDAGDIPAMEAVLPDLIKLNNKTTYWNTLLRIERQNGRDDHDTLMIYRIMYNTHSMNLDTDYIEMAQLLGDAALPGEAAAVLDRAMTSGAIKEEHKERVDRLLTAFRTRADSDKKGLPQEEAEADQNTAGELLVKLGEVYYGFGEYQKTIDAIAQGLQKGSVTQMDEALVYLGLAQLQLKSYAEAKDTLASMPTASVVTPRLARLWRLYAGNLPTG
jgi:tetratricopeptide (TPR) repeat protein